MAKFTSKNIEFSDYQSAVFGTDDDSAIFWDGSLNDLRLTTTISGVDPTEDYHLTTRWYVNSAVAGAGAGVRSVVFSHSLTWNGPIDLLGWYYSTDSSVGLSSGSPVTMSEDCYHSHVIIDVLNPVGLPFTIAVSGLSVAEDTGDITAGDIENLNITSSGTYQTSKSWIDAPQLSIVEGGKSCTLDIYRSSYSDQANTDFKITALRFEFEPDSPNWDMRLELISINNDGEFGYIDDVTFDNLDSPERAANGKIGKYKRTDYDYTISGSLNEGFILRADQTGIGHFYVEVMINDA